MSEWSSDWGRDERRAYAKGIEKGQQLAYVSDRDKNARAALMGLLMNPSRYSNMQGNWQTTLAEEAYRLADAMDKARTGATNEEIPF